MSLLQLDSQCCDADRYIQIGYLCAKVDICYDVMRPVGSIYWFSLPFLLGVTLDMLVFLQLAMFAIVCMTAFFVFHNSCVNRESPVLSGINKKSVLVWLFLAGVLGIWLRPTFFVALSDAPASLIFIEAILLLLLAEQRKSSANYLLAGLLLGTVPLLRTSYFYPIKVAMVLLVIVVVAQCWRNRRLPKVKAANWRPLLLLAFCLPLSLQYWVNWKELGEASFVTSGYGDIAYNHLLSNAAGYDTVFPERAYSSSPVCANTRGILPDVQAGNWSGAICMLANRARFYFGSYAGDTYLGARDRNYFSHSLSRDVGGVGWETQQLGRQENAAISPSGIMDAPRLTPLTMLGEKNIMAEIASLMPLPPDKYRFSAWLWADTPTTITMRGMRKKLHDQKERDATGQRESIDALSEQDITLGTVPRFFSLDVDNVDTGYLALQLGWFQRSDASRPAAPFYAWGSKLENSANAIGYVPNPYLSDMGLVGQSDDYAYQRHYSLLLLFANLLAAIMACLFLWHYARGRNIAVAIFIAGMIASLLGESLLVIPEQRFVQGLLMAVWLLACLYVMEWINAGRKISDTRMPLSP